MSMQRYILLFLFFLCLSFSVQAQQLRGVCGNTYQDQMSQIDRYVSNLKVAKTFPSRSRNAITYLPIQFQIITRNDGSGATEITDLLEQFCRLNEQFSAFDIVFYQSSPPRYIASDIIYNDHTKTSGLFTMRNRRNRSALNVWIVENAAPKNGPEVGLTLGYYDRTNDWIVIRRNQISGVNNTLAHEVGHFFSLFHPHLGWDSEPYDVEKHGNPVSLSAPGGGSTELMDRSNCDSAGDMLCDTPPDYNFALNWRDCNFNAKIQDPNGTEVDPDESLIMSYFKDECTSKFTDTQVEMMLADIARPGRNFLRNNDYSPLATTITAQPNLLSPAQDAVTASYNKVRLRWEAVTGANSYLVEVDRSSGFNIDNFQFTTSETNILLDNILDADRNYRWRITPYNDSYTCATPSETGKFRTSISTSISTISSINNWAILPNPVKEAGIINIQVNAKTAFEADLKIYNLTGQLVHRQATHSFTSGAATISVPINHLTKGIYFIALENEEGIANQKLVVQ